MERIKLKSFLKRNLQDDGPMVIGPSQIVIVLAGLSFPKFLDFY